MHNLAVTASGAVGLLTSPGAVAACTSEARKPQTRKARERGLALSHMVRTEIIPQLLLLHPATAKDPVQSAPTLDTKQIAAFAALVVGQDIAPVFEAFTRWLTKGYTTDELFLDLLAPSAVLLRYLWEEDLCDSIEVTVGLARLQVLLFTYQTDEVAGSVRAHPNRTIPLGS